MCAFFTYNGGVLKNAYGFFQLFVATVLSFSVSDIVMMNKQKSKTSKLTISALVMAMYIAIMLATQSFAFGAYQVRVATGLYALAYVFPFLVVPLGLANSLSNLIGGLGILDIVGGFGVGIVTAGGAYLLGAARLPKGLVIPVIIAGPGFIVPLWLSPITGIPYLPLVASLCIGQTLPGILGYVLIRLLAKWERIEAGNL